jgi:hypothetical protein
LSNSGYDRDGNDLLSLGLYVELGPWGCHFFQCKPIGKGHAVSATATCS